MITDAQKAAKYALGGNARMTLVSKKTGVRFTYQLTRAKPAYEPSVLGQAVPIYWVKLLTGPNNERDYDFVGKLQHNIFILSHRSPVSLEAPSVLAFQYFARHVLRGGVLPPELEVHHDGRCGKCRRSLTVPTSVADGLGPECKNSSLQSR